MIEALRALLRNPVVRGTAIAFIAEIVAAYGKAFVDILREEVDNFAGNGKMFEDRKYMSMLN